ncbi:MAG: hypothetical protein M3071_25500 [Actinomycetota bacterium]|nr:hypothetical protein [Actinomycetota bacterium]
MATRSVVSAITAGLHAIGSRSTAKPKRLLERRALTHLPGQIAAATSLSLSVWKVDALALEDAAQAVVVRERAVVDEAQVSGRGRSTTGGECSVVTRLSVALRV